MTQSDPINLIFLRAVGFQRLAAVPVEIQFNPEGITFIEGKNGSGKSSALDSLLFAWAGKSALAKQPIHEGLDEASVEIGLSNGRRVVRHVKRKGKSQYTTGLELFGPEGEKYQATETTVREWLGDPGISFDPMEFSRMDPKKRRVLLAKLVGIDLDQFDADEKQAEQARLAHYGVYETAKRKKESLPPVPATKPKTVDVAELNRQLDAAIQAKNASDGLSVVRGDLCRDHAGVLVEIKNTEAEIDRLRKALAVAEDALVTLTAQEQTAKAAWDDALKADEAARAALPDIQAIQTQLAEASEINRAAVEYEVAASQRSEIEATWKAEEAKRETLTKAVEDVREARLKALQTATFPIEGLGFEAEDCTFHGIPFSQASQSEKIKVGMAIAMAQHPTLKVISSYDGSLLDGDNLAVIDEMAKGQGYTVVLEVVSDQPSGKPNSIYLEDGCTQDTTTEHGDK